MTGPVLIAHADPSGYIDALRERFAGLDLETVRDDEDIAAALVRVEPEIVFSIRTGRFPGPFHVPVITFPSVKWLHNGGVGVDHLPPWDTAKITVTNGAGVNSRFMVETVLGAMIALNFDFPALIDDKTAKRWNKREWTPLEDQTLLIMGMGGIGRALAAKAKTFGMRVIGYRSRPEAEEHVDRMVTADDLSDVLGEADFVCVHVASTPGTRHLINADTLSRMKPGAYLINTSRGAVVDEAAIFSALESGHLGGAYLDVFDTEPLPQDSPLWEAPNLIISPHISDSVDKWETRFARFFGDQLERRLAGDSLLNIVDPERGY